jgi:hypothetical protein
MSMMHRQKKGARATLAHRNPVFVDDADGRLQKRDIQASEIWASDFRVTLCTTSNQGHLPAHVPSMGHCDKPGTGGERINKIGRGADDDPTIIRHLHDLARLRWTSAGEGSGAAPADPAAM